MAYLIGNGTTLYRRSSSLVRTPITITLSPDQSSWYGVVGQYISHGTVINDPVGGFVAQSSATSIRTAGQTCRSRYRSPTDSRQIWRNVSSSVLPANLFYQGAWSPAYGDQRGEAYLQLAGYHFTLPSGLEDLEVTGVRLKITHGGEVFCYQSASSQKTNNFYAQNYASKGSDWSWIRGTGWDTSTWVQKVGLFSSLSAPLTMYNNAQDTVSLNTGLTTGGNPLGYTKLWRYTPGGATNADGYYPHGLSPYVQSYSLSDTIAAALSSARSGWIVCLPNVTADDPEFYSSSTATAFYWLCSSMWGYQLEVDLG